MAFTPYNDANKPEQPGANLMPNPDQVNEFHRYSDQDTSPEAQHHSLGVDPNQASPGNHTHDGKNSPLIANTEFLQDWFVWPPGVSDVGPHYQAPTSMQNNWVPADAVGTHGPPGYRKDPTGIVRLRGNTKNTATNPITTASVIANLPAEYRPRDFQEFIVAGVDDFGNSAWGRIRVERGGNVVYNGQLSTAGRTQHTWIALDGINFVAEN